MTGVKTLKIYREYIKIAIYAALLVVFFMVMHKEVSVDRIIETGGIIALTATIFAETGLLIGFFLPGDTLLFAAGFFAAQGRFGIAAVIIMMFLAAVLGNMVGYEIGRRSGNRLFNKPDSIFFHKDNVDKAKEFFKAHGGKTIIFARFIPVVRTISPPLAGMGKMSYPRFMAYNIIGASIWVPGITLIGYWAGKVLGKYINIDHYILPIVLFATFATFGVSFWHVLRDPISRQKLKDKFISLKNIE